MDAKSVTGAGERMADQADPCRQTVGTKAIRELRIQLGAMHEAAQVFLTDDTRRAYWTSAWESAVVRAATRVESNRKQFYGFRLTAISSAIIVPSLVGLNLSGAGGMAVRWVTFALSLVAALSTAILTLLRFGDRWFIDRTLNDKLVSAGWTLLNSANGDLVKAWTTFRTSTDAATARYNVAYETEIIFAVQPKSGDDDQRQGEPSAQETADRQ